MSILTLSGRAALAAALKSRPLHWAWGSGETWWDAARAEVKTFASNALALTYPNVSAVTVASQDGGTIYTLGTDYTVDAAAGTVGRVISGAIPNDATVAVNYTPSRPDPSPAATGLVNELGRRTITEAQFVVADPAGDIVSVDGRWTVTDTQTENLYVRTVFDFEDASGSTIREVALFMDTVPNANLPVGQRYFTLDQLTSRGLLVVLENLAPLARNVAIRQTFDNVITL